MSANNMILVKKYKGRFYVFNNVMAESWSKKNELSVKSNDGVFDTEEEAMKEAFRLDDIPDDFTGFNSEYGVGKKLIKDNRNVLITD
jgi:hypothetical protein